MHQINNLPRASAKKTRIEQAETRTEQAKTRADAAETRTEKAETRTDSAKTRTEKAETRTEQAETRAEIAETTLERVNEQLKDPRRQLRLKSNHAAPLTGTSEQVHVLEQLTTRRREILQLIAYGQNTKQIAGMLKISPKTVEYHRLKLMHGLDIHDIPGLVRFAIKVGLMPPES